MRQGIFLLAASFAALSFVALAQTPMPEMFARLQIGSLPAGYSYQTGSEEIEVETPSDVACDFGKGVFHLNIDDKGASKPDGGRLMSVKAGSKNAKKKLTLKDVSEALKKLRFTPVQKEGKPASASVTVWVECNDLP